jgi:hypothetical protein
MTTLPQRSGIPTEGEAGVKESPHFARTAQVAQGHVIKLVMEYRPLWNIPPFGG